MNTHTTVNASPAEMQALLAEVIKPLFAELRELQIRTVSHKHAYTVKEVAERIGYSADTVRTFIKEGRQTRNGKLARLRVLEITSGDYRITPSDLDAFIDQF